MTYVLIEDFKGGIDSRKSRATTNAGSLYDLIDGHITRGGEIEQRKAFVQKYILPAGTYGLASVSGTLYSFGSVSDPGPPSGVTYQRLQKGALTMTDIVDTEVFDGKLYVIATFSDGKNYHFYNGSEVTDWSEQLNSMMGFTTKQEVVNYFTSQLDSDTNITAANSGTTTITVEGAANGLLTVTAKSKKGATVTVTTVTAGDSSTKHKATIQMDAAFDATDAYDIVVSKDSGFVVHVGYELRPEGNAIACYTLGSKMYVASDSVLWYSGVNDPTGWDTTPDDGDTGAGFINMATEVGSENLTGLTVYNKNLAVFTRDTVQIWSVSADDSQNVQLQVMRNSGALAPKTVIPYGGTDVYYLSESGIRSLRARDTSVDTAAVSDVGTAVDTRVRPEVNSLSAAQLAKSIGIIEPVDARYWLSLGDYMWVFSYFPGSKISAWSRYYMGGSVDAIATIQDRVYVRQGDVIKLYGGDDGETYDDSVVRVLLPFLDGGKPATWKSLLYLDIAGSGKWSISVLTDPNNESIKSNLFVVDGITYCKAASMITGVSTHFAAEMSSVGVGYHALHSAALHFTEKKARI